MAEDSIVALATPLGQAAIAVVRLSGPGSQGIIRKICPFIPENPESHRVYYGFVRRFADQSKLDEVLVSFFKKGRSFTGEDSFEISCHGSPYIAREIISELVLAGARLAGRGEFTFRAFMNGRIDLVQAESVLSMIQSDSKQATHQALSQLEGRLSKVLHGIEDTVIYCLAHIEASIDFSTEGLDTLNHSDLERRLVETLGEIESLLESYRHGKVVKDGFNLVLTGAPNVGKSSLLNALIGEDKAIVTSIAGTTRDVVAGSFYVNGVKINILDTAGIRETKDEVEKIGIAKSRKAIDSADAIFAIFDCCQDIEAQLRQFQIESEAKKIIFVGNKRDLSTRAETELQREGEEALKNLHWKSRVLEKSLHFVSAFEQKDINSLKKVIASLWDVGLGEDQSVLSVARHFENLSITRDRLKEVLGQLGQRESVELIAVPLKEALLKVQDTLGKHYDDQILDRVFKEFCLGK